MNRVYAISGSHGTGKSTVLNELRKHKEIIVDDFKVSRAVQSQLGVETLNTVLNAPDIMIYFQELILKAKFEHDSLLKVDSSNKIILVERSFLDIAAYARLWIKSRWTPELQLWFNNYEQLALGYQNIYAGHIIITINDKIEFEHDPNRAGLDTRKEFESVLLDYSENRSPITVNDRSYKKLKVECADLNERIQLILDFLNQ